MPPAASFKIGDRVFFRKGATVSPVIGLFAISRVLPFERTYGFQYRVARVPVGEERIASENELEAAPLL